jgi:NDP-4-keto-2,6-dideoxyhexose 3-C-methyltransferase
VNAVAFRETKVCRICGGTKLESVCDLGLQALTGVFPKARGAKVTVGPLEIVKCTGPSPDACGLVQLRHTYEPTEMYGDNYGYRSGLNRSMVEHLGAKVKALTAIAPIGAGDVVLDIGSNDGTSLSFYPENATLIGIDPTASKFAKYYKSHIKVVADFFSADAFLKASGGKHAKIITSISMFYDLERPLDFVRQVHAALADGGLWHFEQSYLPSMLAATSYDTICHEHIEYYALAQIVWMAEKAGFRIVDVSLNDINGGSFAVTAKKAAAGATDHAKVVLDMLAKERAEGYHTLAPYARFDAAVRTHKTELRALLEKLKADGKKVFGYGASTKGNVLLQYCGIDEKLLACVAEVNEDKFGAFTPGTEIPIVSEQEALSRRPDVFMVLPWHFRANILKRAKPIFDAGAKLLFPLPKIELVGDPG